MHPKRIVGKSAALFLLVSSATQLLFPLRANAQTSFAGRSFVDERTLSSRLWPVPPDTEAGTERIVEIRRVPRGGEAEFKKLPVLGRADLAKLLAGDGVRVVTDQSIADGRRRNQQAREQNRREFAKFFAQNPELVGRLTAGGNAAEPIVTLKNGRTYRLLGNDALIRDLLMAKSYAEDRRTKAQTYEHFYRKFEERLKEVPADGAAKFQKLPKPAQTAGQTVAQINQSIGEVVRLWLDYLTKPKTGPRIPASCRDEEGTGNGGDTSGPCGSLNPNGLRAKITWPLEDFNTCVRDQGARGTCTAFGMSAAVESAIAVKYGRFVNLSEQDLYKKQRLEWFPVSLDYYDDGYFSSLSTLAQLLGGYKYPFERDWDYNKSRVRCMLPTDANGNGRLDDADPRCDAERRYRRSCENYNNANCSDTNHQAQRRCYRAETKVVREVVRESCSWVEGVPGIGRLLGQWVCGPVTELVETVEQVEVCAYDTNIPGTSGFGLTSALPIYVPLGDPQFALDQAKALLAARTPIVFCFNVPDSFSAATANGGFVKFDPKEKSDGGHCVLLTGYVDNKNLPAGVPPGDGGGYFIIKNSWGCDFGDQGYAYLPYSWVKKWGTEMTALTSIN